MNCPFCNQSLPEGALFCGFCGNKLTVEEQPAAPESIEENLEAAESAVSEAAEAAVSVATEASEAAVTAVTEATESVVNAAPEANAVASSSSVNVLPEMPNNIRNGSGVNLSKNGQQPKSENKNAAKAKDVFGKLTATVRSDTQEAAAAVKNGNFKNLLKNKTVLICCAAIIAIILLIIIISCASAAGSAHKIKGGYYRVDDGVDAAYFYNGVVVKNADLSGSSDILATSVDGSCAVVEDNDDLYLFKGAKASLITDDFDTSSAAISANGKTVTYVSDDSVFVYTGGKPKKIADIENDDICHPVISPNGKVIAFSDLDDDDIRTYAWKGGSKVIDLDSDIIPVSVSDGGKMIYGANIGGRLCYIKNLKKGAEEKIDSVSQIAGISFDHNKIIYISDGETYCFDTSLNKEEGVEIDNGAISLYSDFRYQGSVPYIKNFKKFYGKEDGNLYKYFRKGKGYDDEKLVSDIGSVAFSDDYKSIVYIDDGDVMKGTVSNVKNAKEIGKDAVSIRTNESLSAVYYYDDDDTLRYTVKDKKIASDVDKYVVTENGVCVFSDSDGDLYYSSKGGEKKKVGLDEISSLTVRNKVVYVVSDGEVYTSTNGKSFKETGVDAD